MTLGLTVEQLREGYEAGRLTSGEVLHHAKRFVPIRGLEGVVAALPSSLRGKFRQTWQDPSFTSEG